MSVSLFDELSAPAVLAGPSSTSRMTEESLLSGLNPQQRDAVVHEGGPLLVVAGAGSGKTRVLVHRIGWVISQRHTPPGAILAITFTNKAAGEMKERVAALVGPRARSMWVMTFHSACVRILREQASRLGRKTSFSIYDQTDSLRLVTAVLRDLDIDPKRYTPRFVAGEISNLKNELVDPATAASRADDDRKRRVAEVYVEYQRRLLAANAYDFDDLIMETGSMLQAFPDVADHYRRRFRHVLVDEYQDTNHAQYQLVRAIVGSEETGVPVEERSELCVVGDADQSIYAFRGADIRNIVEFERDYPDARVVLLEQNYRSTQTILSAANAVIDKNPDRKPKRLWSELGDGEQILGHIAENQHDEAAFVAQEIDKLVDSGDFRYSDVAVFYRTNAQSRVFEDVFMRVGMPYRVVGGQRFYDRKEIRDAVAYLRVVANPADTVSMERIINTPRRGLGDKGEEVLRSYADRERQPLSWAVAHAGDINGLAPRVVRAMDELAALLDEAREPDLAPSDALQLLLDRSGYRAELQASEDLQAESRLENLDELVSVVREFEERVGAGEATVAAFLEQVSLIADADSIPDEEEGNSGVVTLMTLHNAKGLEYPAVFLSGLEDGVFPHMRTFGDERELQEERRLAYVGLTRAQQRLFISRALSRTYFGQRQAFPPSRFLDEVPASLIDWQGLPEPAMSSQARRIQAGLPRTKPSAGLRPVITLAIGDRVSHDTFGLGTVVGVSGEGDRARAKVDFGGDYGSKELLLRYAPVEKI